LIALRDRIRVSKGCEPWKFPDIGDSRNNAMGWLGKYVLIVITRFSRLAAFVPIAAAT
jgi:hypothetical protein